MSNRQRLKISEVFLSLQGEANQVGWPTVFVRLTGCPLRCHYCDSEYAFSGGEWYSFNDLLSKVQSYQVNRICVTGGEPLAQKSVHSFLELLCDQGFQVSLETSGALPLKDVDSRVEKVMDIKTPSSGEVAKNHLQNLAYLQKQDQLKFVISDDNDYQWSKSFIQKHNCENICTLLFSPSWQVMSERELAEKILQDKLNVRLQIQLHKYLWGDRPGV